MDSLINYFKFWPISIGINTGEKKITSVLSVVSHYSSLEYFAVELHSLDFRHSSNTFSLADILIDPSKSP